MTMRAFGPGPCGVPKATLEKWERDINEAVAKASEAGAGISPPPSYALDPSYLDQRVLAAGLPVRRGRVLGWSPERGPRGSYRVQLAAAQVWAEYPEYPGVGFVLGDDVSVYLDDLGAAWHASSRGVDGMLHAHAERKAAARDIVGEIRDAFRALGWDVDGAQASLKAARPAVFAAWDTADVALSTGDDPRWGVTISREIDAAARADIRGFVAKLVSDLTDDVNRRRGVPSVTVVKPSAPGFFRSQAEFSKALDAEMARTVIGTALADSTPNADGTYSVAIALGGAPAPRPDAGMVRCGRCGGPAGYLGIRCERVGGCRTAEERVAAMEPVVMGRLDEQRYSADVWEVWATDACDEWAWVIGPGRNAKRYATRDLAVAAWREEMVRRERAKDGRS